MIGVAFKNRGHPSLAMRLAAPILAGLLTFLAILLLLKGMGEPAWSGFYSLFIVPMTSVQGLADILVKAAPLALMGAGLSLAFRAKVWNIGAQGQYIAGALLGSLPLIYGLGGTGFWPKILVIFLGVVGGIFYAAIPAFLATRYRTNLILTSLMLDYVALSLLHYLTFGPWRDPMNYGFPGSISFPASLQPAIVWPHTQFDTGALIAFGIPILLWLVLRWSVLGLKIRVAVSDAASRYAGFSRSQVVWSVMVISGACAGLAGFLQVVGPIDQLRPSIDSGLGFSAIIVAYLAQLNPLAAIPTALLVGLFEVGGVNAQIQMGLSHSLAELMQGLLLFFVLGANILVIYRPVWRWR